MKLKLLGLVLGGTFAVASFGGVAFAASDNHVLPGTPGDKNCVGQTMAYVAQGNVSAFPGPGIGNAARQAGLTVKEVNAIIEAYCAAP